MDLKPPAYPIQVPLLSEKDVEEVNEDVKCAVKEIENKEKGCGRYHDYTAEERASIGS